MNTYRAPLGAVAALMIFAQPANAVLQLASEFNNVAFSCVDNNATCDQNPAVGIIQLGDQTVGGVQVNGSIQTQTIGGVNVLNTSSLSVINNNTVTVPIEVTVSGTNFTGPNNTFDASGSGTYQQAVGSALTLTWFDDPTNTQGAAAPGNTPGGQVASFHKDVTAIADSFSADFNGAVNDPALFSMTIDATGTLTAGGQLLSRGQTLLKSESQSVPEPGTLTILGTALAVLGLLIRRRGPAGLFA